MFSVQCGQFLPFENNQKPLRCSLIYSIKLVIVSDNWFNMPYSCSVPAALYSDFAEMPHCVTAVTFQLCFTSHWQQSCSICGKWLNVAPWCRCYLCCHVGHLFSWFFFVIWQIFEEQECCLLLRWGPEQIVTFQHPYLVLLPYSIRPCGVLTLWWPARLLPWRLPSPSLSSERSGPDSGSQSGGDWLWPEQRNTARTVSKHCDHVNFPGVRMCKPLVFQAAVYRWDQWDLLPCWNVEKSQCFSVDYFGCPCVVKGTWNGRAIIKDTLYPLSLTDPQSWFASFESPSSDQTQQIWHSHQETVRL